MSAAIRAALAAAVNAHLGANKVTPYYRQTATPGWGWISRGTLRRDESGFGYMDTWEIRIVCSQEIAKAEKWIDDHLDPLLAALDPALVVTAAAPGVLNLDTKTTVNALIIEGVREH